MDTAAFVKELVDRWFGRRSRSNQSIKRAGALFRVLIGLVLLGGLGQAAAAGPAAAQADCAPILAEFDANPGWLAELRDPRFHSQAEIAKRVTRYQRLVECTSAGDIPVTGEMAQARDLASLFVTLAGGLLDEQFQGPGQGYLLAFANLQDPAVIALRDEVGIPQPDGFVYIWLFPTRETMPPILQNVFSNPAVRGVTLQTRYVVVLDQVERGTPLEAVQRRQRSATLSHEFVHAYIKSAMGPEQGFALPRWYDEGLAIYFSSSSQPTSVVFFDENGHQRYWSAPPKDYARFRDMFAYLEREYGRAGLVERIRRSVLENDPALLYRELGARSEHDLYTLAEDDRIRRSLTRLGLIVGPPALAALFIVMVKTLGLLAGQFSFSPDRFRRVYDPADIAYLRAHRNLPALKRLLKYHRARDPAESAAVRYAAARALAELNDLSAIESLLDALDDENSLVRAAAARSLGSLVRIADPPDAPPTRRPGRARILAALFGLLRGDPLKEVRWVAAEAIYLAGGLENLRPILAEVRRWFSRGGTEGQQADQRWFFNWAVRENMDGLLIDMYPWFDPESRRSVIRHFSTHMPTAVLERLSEARDSGDPALRELASAVIEQPTSDLVDEEAQPPASLID